MEELANVIRRYGDIELLAVTLENIDYVETTEELIVLLEDELSYMEE